jgi:hypothetical protein
MGPKPLTRGVFSLDGMFENLPGYTTGDRWNGWATPKFPLESVRLLIAQQQRAIREKQLTPDCVIPVSLDTADGAVIVVTDERAAYGVEDESAIDRDPGCVWDTPDGPQRLWSVGAYAWCWEEA